MCILSLEDASHGCKYLSPAGGANSAPQNPLTGFKGPLRGREEKRGEREGREEKRKERGWEKTPLPEINFWLKPCSDVPCVCGSHAATHRSSLHTDNSDIIHTCTHRVSSL